MTFRSPPICRVEGRFATRAMSMCVFAGMLALDRVEGRFLAVVAFREMPDWVWGKGLAGLAPT